MADNELLEKLVAAIEGTGKATGVLCLEGDGLAKFSIFLKYLWTK